MTNLCVCPSFKKSFTSGETPGPGLWRLYISIHNWWPRLRQTAHYTCNMDSVLVSDACPRVDLTLSHHCVCRGSVCESVCVCLCLLQPKMKWADLLFSSSCLADVSTACSSYGISNFQLFFKYCFDFVQVLFCFTHFGSCTLQHLHNKPKHSGLAATFVDS